MNMKRIVYITGSKADFGRMYYTLKSIKEHPGLTLHIIATGMHLSREQGYTIQEVDREFRIDSKIDMLLNSYSGGAMAKSLGIGVLGITQALEDIKPDIVLLLGDRGEMLAGAIASSHLNILTAHIGGGHVSGSIDDRIRDAISVLSDIHFVATKGNAERVMALGVDASKVYIVGAPDLDAITDKAFAPPDEVAKNFALDLSAPIILVSQHPVTTEAIEAGKQMRETMEAIIELGMPTIVTYPNSDAGGDQMLQVLEKYHSYPFVQIHRSIPYPLYLGLMNVAKVIVGNSSAGIIEAPSFGLPAVNIGTRQKDRERAENVIDVGYDKEEIKAAIQKTLHDRRFMEKAKRCCNPYGDGKTSQRIVKILSTLEITHNW
jgi:GDP/UDP-N,N'-diacetylbacillosamine 2-epimerase (hydrolysing)